MAILPGTTFPLAIGLVTIALESNLRILPVNAYWDIANRAGRRLAALIVSMIVVAGCIIALVWALKS